MNPRALQGKRGEDLACEYLAEQGLVLIERNYRCRTGELDLIMRDGSQVVFIEVRLRRSHRYGHPEETVTRTKQTRLIRAAAFYLQSRRIDSPCRFDVIAIVRNPSGGTLRWIKDAFQAF